MRNLTLIICIAFMACGCGKDKTIEKSKYAVVVFPDLLTGTGDPIQIKYRISGADIKTIDNLGPRESVSYIDLPKGKSTTVTVAIYEGPQRSLHVEIYKADKEDLSSEDAIFTQTALNQVSATFTVK